MAGKKNGTTKKNGAALQLPSFMKEQLEDAQKRFVAFEGEAQKVLENLIERGRESRKELETLLTRFQGLEQKATKARTDARKRLDKLQNRVIESVGVASQAQVQQLNREIVKLSKKLDQLVPKKAASKGDKSTGAQS